MMHASRRVRRPRVYAWAAVCVAVLAALVVSRTFVRAAAPFTPGNLVVYRVGSGTGSLVNTGSPIFLDEFTPAGALVQSVPIPTATSGANRRLVASGTATSEGLMTLSADGRYLVLGGYDAAIPTTGLSGTTGATVPRVVARVDSSGNIDSSTALTDWSSGNNPRGVASADGSGFWVTGGTGGVRYSSLGGTTSVQVSSTVLNNRAIAISGGQLYSSDSSGAAVRLGTVGTGLPTTAGQVITNLPGFPTAGSPYGFIFADLSAAVAGDDTVYVASDDAAGITKYSLTAGAWVATGTIGVAADAYRGLTGSVSGATVTLFATRNGGSGAAGGGQLVSITDATGYQGVLAAAPVLLATAAPNTAFRGVAFAPAGAPSITGQPLSQTIGSGSPATLSVTATGAAPLGYQWFVGAAGDTANPVAGATTSVLTTPALAATTSYWVRVANGFGQVDSATAVVTVVAVIPPSIPGQPLSQTIESGATAVLSVTATGSAPLAYQWYVGVSGDTSAPAPGATSSGFTTPALLSTTSYWVQVANAGGVVNSLTATVTVTPPPCSSPYVRINQVQGTGDVSPLAGQTLRVRGVVVGDMEGASPALRGFYLQSLAADDDADPATSEGLFVFEGSNANSVSVGQVVDVTGVVQEFQGQTQVSLTAVEGCGTAVVLVPADVQLPVPAAASGVPHLERFEGMLVRFHQTLYVTEHFQLGRFGQIVMSAAGRLPQPTSVAAPGALAQAQQRANELNRIIVDDDLNSQNPDPIRFGRNGLTLTAFNTLRGGDTVTDLVGVMTYTWAGNAASGNAYRVRPVTALGGGVPVFQAANPRPAAPPAVGGTLKVVGMNVLNYFLTLDNGQAICGPVGSKQTCRGAGNASELSRQRTKLTQALLALDADVIGFAELENSQDAQGVEVNALADIVERLNTSLGSSVYGYIDTGIVGTDTIRVGIGYKVARVTPVGAAMVDPNPVHNRPPVAQPFLEAATGETFTLVVNHFKSKGCGGAAGTDGDQGDGQGCFNATRVSQAQALTAFLNGTVIPSTADPDVVMVGDFNAYAKEDPILTLELAGFTNLVSRFSGKQAYSYVFDGQWGYLDHALVSSSVLAQVSGAADYHINADEPSVLDYNEDFKSAGQVASLYNADQYRISDHDPVVVGLALQPTPVGSPDSYNVEAGSTLVAGVAQGVLANDGGGLLSIVDHTQPSHGSLTLNPDGSFSYTPDAGYTGPDSFSYTVSSTAPAYTVQLFATALAPLATIGGVDITGGGFGSALAAVPGSPDQYYGLTDRGPNVDGPGGSKIEPLPSFTPMIGRFTLTAGQAVLDQIIPLRAADGTPYNGRVNSAMNRTGNPGGGIN